MYSQRLILLAITSLLIACGTVPDEVIEQSALPAVVDASITPPKFDYPTRDRVQYVLDCIAQHATSTVKFGGINYVTQYACGCKIDKIAEKLNFDDFEAAVSGAYLSKLPGESGAAFRGSDHAKELKKRFKEAEQSAEKACFVK